MALLIHNITLGLDDSEDRLRTLAARKLRLEPDGVLTLQIARKSLDARARRMSWIYSVIVTLAGDESRALARARTNDVRQFTPHAKPQTQPGRTPLERPPVVIGAGPAGLFAALLLAEAGYRPLLLERGQEVGLRHRDVWTYIRHRQLNPQSNLIFGEGGAGTYSDGKLNTRTHDPLVPYVLQRFVEFGAAPDVAFSGKPHVGSDKLPGICRAMRRRIESLGGQVRFGAQVHDMQFADGRVKALLLADGERIDASCVLLAIGHSARDTYAMLSRQGVSLSARPFQMGLRIEHPQQLIDRAQLGPCADRPDIRPADYHLVAKRAAGDRDVYSFCMCPGGQVLPANHQHETICTNGGSRRARSGPRANSALVMTFSPDQFSNNPLAGLALQEQIERLCFRAAGGDYSLAAQTVADFLRQVPSSGPLETSSEIGARGVDFSTLLPQPLARAIANALPMFDQQIKGFAGPDAVLLGPETRASCPVRIDRDPQTRASASAANLYPAGEGAGYAGGIVSSAVDGLRSAEAIIARYANP